MANRRFTFVWKISNFFPCYQGLTMAYIDSPVFIADCLDGSRWHLRIHPSSGREKGYANCYLFRVKDYGSVETLSVEYEITINVGNGENLISFKRKGLFTKDGCYSGSHFISLNELTNAMKNCDENILSISCAFATTNPICDQAIGCEARTEIGVKRCSFLLNVDETIISNRTQIIKCPYPEICPIEITLTSPQDDIDIHMHLLYEEHDLPRLVTCKIMLLDMRLIESDSKSDTFLFGSQSNRDEWKFPSFIKKSRLKNERDTFLKNDVFSLMCHFSSATNRIISNIIVQYCCDSISSTDIFFHGNEDKFPTLHSDLSTMWNNKEHSDIKLKTGTEIFPAHKCILAMRSPVFSAMFNQDMVENQTGEVDISDVDAETLKSFLEFLYTDSVSEMNYENVSKLLMTADKYQVLLLKDKCSNFLISSLSDENVCAVLHMSDMMGHELLKNTAINYIKAHSQVIFLSSEWRELIKNNCQLVTEVFYTFSAEFSKILM